jgi:hypothetical protein
MKPVFLSYSRKNLDDVQQIANMLCAGGIPIWQDIQSLATGNTDAQVRRAIREQCSAFFIYLTEESSDSQYICENEIPEALIRSDEDSTFCIIPLVRMQLAQANQKLKGILRGDISRYNGVIMHSGDSLEAASRQIRKILLKAITQIPLEKNYFEISLMTYSRTPGNIYPHLDLDWSRLSFPAKLSSDETWKSHLLPALMDVKDALLNAGHTHIKLFSKATLTSGLAFGYLFRRETGFKLDVLQAEQWWATGTRSQGASRLKIRDHSRDTGSRHLGVNLSITALVNNYMGSYIKEAGLSFRAELCCEPETGPARAAVQDGEVAAVMAWEIGNAVRKLRGNYNLTDIHIFAAMPLGLAYLIGAELNACGRIHLYEFDKSESKYRPSWILEGDY